MLLKSMVRSSVVGPGFSSISPDNIKTRFFVSKIYIRFSWPGIKSRKHRVNWLN